MADAASRKYDGKAGGCDRRVAIVVIGCKPYARDGSVSAELSARVGKGVELYQRDFGELILFSGGNPFSDIPEALIMKSLARMVPKGDILLEIHSRSTRENAILSKRILLRHGIRDIILVTSPYHVPRALENFRDVLGAGFNVHAVSSDFALPIHSRIWKRAVEVCKWYHLLPERWLQRIG